MVVISRSRWHDIEKLGPTLLAICQEKPLVLVDCAHKGPVGWRFDICFAVNINKNLLVLVDSAQRGPVMWLFEIFFAVNVNRVLNKQLRCQ